MQINYLVVGFLGVTLVQLILPGITFNERDFLDAIPTDILDKFAF